MSPFPEKETLIPSCFGNKQSDYQITPIFNPQLKISGSDSHSKANLPSGQSSPAFISKSSLTRPTAGGCRASSSTGPAQTLEPKGPAGFCSARREKWPVFRETQAPRSPADRHTRLGTWGFISSIVPEPFVVGLTVCLLQISCWHYHSTNVFWCFAT